MVFKELNALDWRDSSGMVRQRGFFDSVELDVLVAVPDADAIQWPGAVLVEVSNADELPQLVTERVEQYRHMGVGAGLLVPEQHRRLAEFLVFKHRPALVHKPLEPSGNMARRR